MSFSSKDLAGTGYAEGMTSKWSTQSSGRQIGILAIGNYLTLILRLAAGLITVRLLTPEQLGTLNAALLVCSYADFLQAGIINGLNRELPYLSGKGNLVEAKRLAACAWAWSRAWGLLSLGAAGSWAAWLLWGGKLEQSAAWGACAVTLATQFANNYLMSTFRTTAEFSRLAQIGVASTLVNVLLIYAVWLLGYYGQCFRIALSALVTCGLFWIYRPMLVRARFRRPEFFMLLKIGFPIFIVGYIFQSWQRLDSVFITNFMSHRDLGVYSLSGIVLQAGMAITGSLGMVIYTRMGIRFGETGDAWAALRYSYTPTLLTALLMLPLLGVGWWAMPLFVVKFIPGYIDGVFAAQWTLLPVFLLSLQAPNNIFNVIGRQLIYGGLIIIGVLVFVAALRWRVDQVGKSLVVFPQAMACGLLVFLLLANLAGVLLALHHRRCSHAT